MAKLGGIFRVNLNGRNVMIGGKSAEEITADLEAGVARIGGRYRHPNYFEAYLHSASLLIEQGRTTGTLDEVGLPAFYLQRHAIELLLKGLLSWLTSISYLRNELGKSQHKPSNGLMNALTNSHRLDILHGHLLSFSRVLDLPTPPASLGCLIKGMRAVETADTWSRYSSSWDKLEDGTKVQVEHIPNEVLIPIVEFQGQLDAIAALVAARVAYGDTYEDELCNIWAQLDADLNSG